jgi:hypothetical protein
MLELSYPGPTLRVLELVQQKAFRDRLGDVNFVMAMADEITKAADQGRPK